MQNRRSDGCKLDCKQFKATYIKCITVPTPQINEHVTFFISDKPF